MYKYVSCLSRTNATRPQYVLDDISEMQCVKIMQDYVDNWVVLSSPFLTSQVSLRLQDDYFSAIANFQGTFNEWLVSLGDQSLKTTTVLPNMKEHSAQFTNLNQYWFKQTPTNITSSVEHKYTYAESNDLLITKDNIDYQYLFDRALFTVNGYIHRSSLSKDGIYILDAIKSSKVPNDTHTGVLTFDSVSTLTCYPITEDQFRPSTDYSTYNDRILLQTPFSTAGKQVGIVIGGIFYCQVDAISIIGEQLASLNTLYINWVDRFFYDSQWIDLSSIPTGQDPDEPEVVYSQYMQTEAFYKAWLLLSQSFWVVFDNPTLEFSLVPLTPYRWPGQYGHVNAKNIPVLLNSGVLAEPLIQSGDQQGQLYVRHYHRRRGLNTTVQYTSEPMVTDYSLMSDPWTIPTAYWLKISTY